MNTTQNSNDAVSFIYECLVDNPGFRSRIWTHFMYNLSD